MTEAQGTAVINLLTDQLTRLQDGLPAVGELHLIYWWLTVLTLAILVLVFFEGLKVYRDW